MFDAGSFDTPYVVVGKTFAKSAGILSEREVRTFFRTLEGGRSIDWYYVNNGVIVEWNDMWNVLDMIKAHSIFHVMPVNIIPADTLAEKLSRFNSMRSKPFTRTNTRIAGWFDSHTIQQPDEDDIAFEHRLIKTLAAVFTMIKKMNPIKKSA